MNVVLSKQKEIEMIEIPDDVGNGSGAKRVKGGVIISSMWSCQVCGSEIKKPKWAVRVIYGTHIGTPEEATATHVIRDNGTVGDGGDCGWLPVGATSCFSYTVFSFPP